MGSPVAVTDRPLCRVCRVRPCQPARVRCRDYQCARCREHQPYEQRYNRSHKGLSCSRRYLKNHPERNRARKQRWNDRGGLEHDKFYQRSRRRALRMQLTVGVL